MVFRLVANWPTTIKPCDTTRGNHFERLIVALVAVAIAAHWYKSVAIVVTVFILRLTAPACFRIDHLPTLRTLEMRIWKIAHRLTLTCATVRSVNPVSSLL